MPIRRNTSKWFVDASTYPFEWYPKYCEGFAYITNLNTVRFMREQSRRIPRFWIDDVYFTGFLFHGIDDITWLDYKSQQVRWAYYDFWDLGNTLPIYQFYAYLLSFFSVSVIDFYKFDHFVILHAQPENEEVNYNSVTTNNINLTTTTSVKNTSTMTSNRIDASSCINAARSGTLTTRSRFAHINSTNFDTKSSSDPMLISSSHQHFNCLNLISDRKFVLNIYFYEFCHKLWNIKIF